MVRKFDESYAIEWADDWFGDMMAFVTRELVRYGDDNLPNLKAEIIEWAKCIAGRADEFEGPWCRFPRELVWSGIWAEMTGGERRVYGALLGLVDPRSLVTFASLATIGEKAGCSEDRASKALTALKKRALIRRWPSRRAGCELWFTRLVPHAAFEDAQDAAVLRERVIPQGSF